MNNLTLSLTINKYRITNLKKLFKNNSSLILIGLLTLVSILSFVYYYQNGLGLAYNDARSHLDIGRRVVEGLKPGLAQLGSVWLPLPHALMIPTIWNDFFWHSGLSGAIISMISFVATAILVFMFLEKLKVGLFGRLLAVFVFATNINVLYLQSTAMTELLLMAVMTAGVYELLLWHKTDRLFHLLLAGFWIMLSTLVRYDGWFLFAFATALVVYQTFRKKGLSAAEGVFFLFCTLGGFGIFLWFLWNQLIFKDALYFAFGPFSAHAQQDQLEKAGNLVTKGNLLFSTKTYLLALIYNNGLFISVLGLIGGLIMWFDKSIKQPLRMAALALTAPFIFNILALFLGHSVLFIQGVSGNTWFNVRYGLTIVPTIAIYVGYLAHRWVNLRWLIVGLLLFVTTFQFLSRDAVTIDDATVGSSQKNVTEVSGWLKENSKNQEGFILISAASHDAIIFSSTLPMKKYIHEGTGRYWEEATTNPQRWARWIIMRTHDENDLTFKSVSKTPYNNYYNLVGKYPFADIYELKSEYLPQLITQPILGKQK